jgi:hypothetical protein
MRRQYVISLTRNGRASRSKRREASPDEVRLDETKHTPGVIKMAGKSTEKFVVNAIGTIDGKRHVWTAAIFNSVKDAKPWVALLNLARKAEDAETVKAMDPHAPEVPEGKTITNVKYSGATIQYAPEAAGLSDDATLG